jgi:hypothetical protein
MEALQLLKFSLKKERLDFTVGWKTSERALYQLLVPSATLGSLFVDDSGTAMDKVLKEIGMYNKTDGPGKDKDK